MTMARSYLVCGILILGALSLAVGKSPADEKSSPKIESRVIETEADEIILSQTAVFQAPVAKVWDAYTTSEGYTAWAAPAAEIDLRIGGTIQFHYGRGGKVGDPGTQQLFIRAVVPHELLTLQAEVSPGWPEVLKKDGERLHNVILFEALADDRTRVRSYGIGYRKTEELQNMLKYFEAANERLLGLLGKYVEEGVRSYERPKQEENKTGN